MSGRELQLPEIVEISRTLARWAEEGGVSHARVCMSVGLRTGIFAPSLRMDDLWFETVRAAHAGRSEMAGFGSDAVARLIDAVAHELRGNDELNRLAYSLGKGAQAAAVGAGKSIFLSYSSADRADVDSFYAALASAAPGILVFQDHRSIAAGADWLEKIRSSANESSLLVCWLTGNYITSAFCNYEVGLVDSRGGRIVPIVADPAVISRAPAYLTRLQTIRASAPLDMAELARQALAATP